MDAPPSLVRLALGGLLLDQRAYRYQRDDPAGLRRGFVLVLLVGLLVGLAAFIGDLGEYFTQPDPALVSQTIYDGLVAMPWYAQADPEVVALVESFFGGPGGFSLTPTPLTSLFGAIAAPIIGLISWFIGGAFVHVVARAFGGAGAFGQTLAATALASATSLLGLVQVVPYAEVFPGSLLLATAILGSAATYVAVRETHGLPPWRSFWAVLVGPLLLSVLALALYCCVVFIFAGAVGGLQGGA